MQPEEDTPSSWKQIRHFHFWPHFSSLPSGVTMAEAPVSETKVVVLGSSWSLRSSVGNLLLDQTVFDTKTEPERPLTHSGQVQQKKISVTVPPELQDVPEDRLREVLTGTAGPHVFLLVLQPEDFTEQHKSRLQSVLESFSEQAFSRSLVLISPATDMTPSAMEVCVTATPVTDVMQLWRDKCFWTAVRDSELDILKHKKLLRQLGLMEEHSPEQTAALKRASLKSKSAIRILLFGKRDKKKTKLAQMITGHLSLHPKPKHGRAASGKWRGNNVTVVRTPDLSGRSVEALTEELSRCVSLCSPAPNVLLLLLKPSDFSKRDRKTLHSILNLFGPEAFNHSMAVFTHDRNMTASATELLCDCDGRYYNMFEAKNDKLLEKIADTVIQNKGSCVTIVDLDPGAEPSLQDLRIALIGKTGSGKSSSGNTILGREEFFTKESQKSVTKVCQKAEAEVEGRHVVIVDTPGLFDTTMSREEVNQEILHCIGLLDPGPHVFLLVLQFDRFTPEEKETLTLIKKGFGKEAEKFMVVLFTHGDKLQRANISIEEYISDCDHSFQELLSDCGSRYHVFNNQQKSDLTQIRELLEKIDEMVKENGGSCYTDDFVSRTASKEEQQ